MTFDIRDEVPLVSVCLITYNHASHIRECLESILQQETDFLYEICIGEDESTDGTREICMEYAARHPERIRLILRSQSEPGREAYAAQGNYNYVETLKACRGRYIADCDGDDVWLDAQKLQKQADIMEADSSLSLVCSDYAVIDAQSGKYLSRHLCRDKELAHVVPDDRKAFMFDVLKSNYKILSSSALMRKAAIDQVLENDPTLFMQFANGDTPLYCELSSLGSFSYIDEPMVAHKVLSESATQSRDPWRRLRFYNRNEDMKLYLARKHGLPMESILWQKIRIANRLAMTEEERTEIAELYRNHKRSFPTAERLLYQLTRVRPIRAFLCRIYSYIYSVRCRSL